MTTKVRVEPKLPASSEAWGQTPAPGPSVALPPATERPLPAVEQGRLVVLRQFDVATEIDLPKLEKLLASGRAGLRRRATAMLLSSPPVPVVLPSRTVTLLGTQVMADCVVRFFEFGAVSVRLRISLPPNTPWERMSALVAEAQANEELTRTAREAMNEVLPKITEALSGAHESPIYEDYLVVFVDRFVDTRATELPADAIARLLLGEPPTTRLSNAEIEEATRHRSSYTTEDLCVAGWASALVVDPEGDTDPLDVLELANAQLLELRYYDSILDHELGLLYDETAERKGRWLALLRNYGPVLRRAMTVMLEIAEFIERAENALKIIGDVYLARLYARAVEALRIPAWERSITRKEALVQQVYDVLKNEVDASRDQLLELTIILLIVGEIVMAMSITK